MILDQLSNASEYFALGERVAAALRYLQQTDFSRLAPGRYDLDGANLFALVQQYETKSRADGFWEAHRKYVDVQYVDQGAELIGFANVADLQAGDYDESKDFLPLQGEGQFILVHAGQFALLAPQDAHMPGIAVNESRRVKKVVVKIATAP